ncbi:MAG: 50S ribosomal protein L10 [Lactobacillaceae bacterium]|jgi:large subunit ribosomal protein L10|nr:50S ribosomal protein L10 [Lactobacillaceae bacterium]
MNQDKLRQKQADVSELAKAIKGAKSFLIFEYLGLSGRQLTELRRKLHNENADLVVAKNNIYIRALGEHGDQNFANLSGPNAFVYANGNEIAPFKFIHELSKDFKFIKFKGGNLENNFVGPSQLQAIASIPGREQLYSMFLSCLQAPIRNFLYGLKAVSEKK